MTAKVLLSPEEYLAMRFDREPEYVRGELIERPMPDSYHAFIQGLLILMLGPLYTSHRLQIRPENRCQVAPDVYRLPDVALFRPDPFEVVPTSPPLMVAEVVSRTDSQVELIQKLRDYAAWGVPHIWIVNPWVRRLAVWREDSEISVDALRLPEYGFELRPEQLFASLPPEMK